MAKIIKERSFSVRLDWKPRDVHDASTSRASNQIPITE